jgi:hypothetical protein
MTEFLIDASAISTFIKVLPFKANIFELSIEKGLQAADIFRALLCLYLVYTALYKLWKLRPDHSPDSGPFYLSLTLDLGIPFCFAFAWILSYASSSR